MEAIDSEFSEEPQWFKKALEDKCDQPSDDAGLTLFEVSKLSRNHESSQESSHPVSELRQL